jgi:hypothetical protein
MYTIINEHAAAIMYMRLVNAALPPALIGKAMPTPRQCPKSYLPPFRPNRNHRSAEDTYLEHRDSHHPMSSVTASQQHWSVEVPNTSRPSNHPDGGRGNIRRSYDPLASPTLGAFGVRTLYEALRRGCDINPLGPCLGYRATRYG